MLSSLIYINVLRGLCFIAAMGLFKLNTWTLIFDTDVYIFCGTFDVFKWFEIIIYLGFLKYMLRYYFIFVHVENSE